MIQGVKWAARFEKTVRRWQVTLGLTDWCFKFQHKPGDGGVSAEVVSDVIGRDAIFAAHLDTQQDDSPERIGLHETLHVLFADMLQAAAVRGSRDHYDVEREEHRVIERLVNAIDGRP